MKQLMRKIGVSLLAIVPILSISVMQTSCSNEEFSAYERVKAELTEKLGGSVSTGQWWKTSVTIQVNVKTDTPVELYLMSEDGKGMLFDYKRCETSGVVEMAAPQSYQTTYYLLSKSNNRMESQKVVLTGKNVEVKYVNTNADLRSVQTGNSIAKAVRQNSATAHFVTRAASDEPDPVHSSLYGSSAKGDGFLKSFNLNERRDCALMMEKYSAECKRADKQEGVSIDYELISKGPFVITWIAGNCMSRYSHVLGYYYHTPGTYSDIKYVDLCETEIYDVIDGYAKGQYQVNQDAVDKYPEDNLVTGKWYAVNFDMYDRRGMSPAVSARAGDNAWNAMHVFERYGRDICDLRGLSFHVDVPAGMCIGFYDRAEEVPRPDQYDIFVKMGIPPYTDKREDFKGTNYTAANMNTYNKDGLFRSMIYEDLDHTMWMGVENDVTGGDLDCNDIIFGITVEMDIYRPCIDSEPNLDRNFSYRVEYRDKDGTLLQTYDRLPEGADTPVPEIPFRLGEEFLGWNPVVEKTVTRDAVYYASYGSVDIDKQPWTIAYEDVARDADFDFNDAVIKIVPDYEKEECCVTVKAAGNTSRMYLHYDGPEGDVNLGEIHELLDGQPGKKINTETSVAQKSFVEIDCVPWPKDYTVANDAKRFYIEIQRGSCDDCTDMITLAETPGQMPQALLIADGEWKWPMEGVFINHCYNSFSYWAKDASKTSYWNWYSNPKAGTYVSY